MCREWIMRSLWELVISTVVLNDRLSLAQPQPQKRARQNAAQLLFLSCLCSERKITGFYCYSVTPHPTSCCSTSLFTTGYRRLTEGGRRDFWWGMDWLVGCFREWCCWWTADLC
jgi:hypothetical protein